MKVAEGGRNGFVAHERADGGEGDAFGVESGCVAVSQSVGCRQGRAGAVAEIEQLSLYGAGDEWQQLRGSRSGLMIDRSCDGLLETAGNGNAAPPPHLRRPDPESEGGEV